jgi:hypothetical protein
MHCLPLHVQIHFPVRTLFRLQEQSRGALYCTSLGEMRSSRIRLFENACHERESLCIEYDLDSGSLRRWRNPRRTYNPREMLGGEPFPRFSFFPSSLSASRQHDSCQRKGDHEILREEAPNVAVVAFIGGNDMLGAIPTFVISRRLPTQECRKRRPGWIQSTSWLD